ncbi:MAG: prepilin-type N-terminal cleavage/methylation domain-containing protein [Planctomycetes bacterium]|nr:prepilin-type N-terminal cleavage/methylation domain-containing protein [Planctomycetota bacterium]
MERCTPQGGRRGGFTLVELLVVLLVISILAGMGTALVSYVMKRATITHTEVLVKGLSQACARYMNTYGAFPPNSGSFQDTDAVLRALGGPTWNNGAKDTTEYLKVQIGGSVAEDPPGSGKHHFVDGWDNKLYYSNNLNSPPAGYAAQKRKNVGQVDVWSGGEDAADNSSSKDRGGSDYGDDITNWSTSAN